MATWWPADVVLFTPYGDESRKSTLVKDVQHRLGHARYHAHWTHAALYVGHGLVVNVTNDDPVDGNKVVLKHVTDFVLRANFRVRRNLKLRDDQRAAIVRRGKELADGKLRYSPTKAVAYAITSYGLRGDRIRRSIDFFEGVVCSDIVSIAYSGGLRRRPMFMSPSGLAVLPATLSESASLHDIEVSWCAIPSSQLSPDSQAGRL